jgi:uncharacterized protein YegP (UPF0339 family)
MISKNEVEIYEDRRNEWRWSLRNLNNQNITADGSEGYATESNARRAARKAGWALIMASFKRVTRDVQNGDYKHGR